MYKRAFMLCDAILKNTNQVNVICLKKGNDI